MMQMNFPRSLGALILTAALAGCSMAPVYQRPDAPIPTQFGQPDAVAPSAAGTLDW